MVGAHFGSQENYSRNRIKNWFTERNEAGWIVENTLSLRGFPNRFDAIIKDIKLKILEQVGHGLQTVWKFFNYHINQIIS